jgi:hypothetical protein
MVRLKYSPKVAARKFIKKYFPNACVAFLAGSAAHRNLTPNSDLDIIVFDDTQFPFKQNYTGYGWPIEAFVLTRSIYRSFFEEARISGLPSMIRMCAEGETIVDTGFAEGIRSEARDLMSEGPYEWSWDERNQARNQITECLEDLSDAHLYHENLFIVNQLTGLVTNFILRANGQWIGIGKWAVRSLAEYDKQLCDEFLYALDSFYKKETVELLIPFIDRVLEPHGGRLLEGWMEGSSIFNEEE